MDRRSFLRNLVAKSAEGATRVHTAMGPLSRPIPPNALLPEEAVDAATTGVPKPAVTPVRAAPASTTVYIDELLAMADEAGLGARRSEVRRLARASARLTTATDGAAARSLSRFGGAPDLPPAMRWPKWRGRSMTFILQLDLSDGKLSGLTRLPCSGLLVVFADTTGTATGNRPSHQGAYRAALCDPPGAASPADPKDGRVPVELSIEMSLPRVWAEAVQNLGLDDAEQQAWQRLRTRVAERQGLVTVDTVEAPVAMHRLLGYPDERLGSMPLTCELISRGHEVQAGWPNVHPAAAEAQAHTDRWHLFMQLSTDPSVRCAWGPDHDRLYLWICQEDLAAGNVDGLHGILQ